MKNFLAIIEASSIQYRGYKARDLIWRKIKLSGTTIL
jgi:hypothetical protein